MEKIGNLFILLTVIVISYFFFRILFDLTIKKDYELISFLLFSAGIVLIIFGYWSKWYVYGFSKASAYLDEEIQRLQQEKLNKNKLTMNQRIDLWVLAGSGVKLFNKIGFAVILISAIFFIISKNIKG